MAEYGIVSRLCIVDRVDFIGLFHFWGIGSAYENRSDSDWIVVAVSIEFPVVIQ